MSSILQRRIGTAIVAIAVGISALATVQRARAIRTPPRNQRDETVVASIRAEPRSFNRYMARDLSTAVLTYLMHGALVRINRSTSALEPELAERWEALPDGRTYRLHLRRHVRFSDGAAFSADDVVFSFGAIYDPNVGSVLAETLQVRGEPLMVTAEDPLTVTIRFPAPFGAGLRMLDGVPIYPRHRLRTRIEEGSFRSAWGPATPPSDIAGLGPFVLRRYEPGQRLTFERNPHFWQRAAGLPALERMVLEIVPDQDAELLELASGAIDVTQSALRPSDLAALKTATAAGLVTLTDGGIGLDGDLLWVNQRPATNGGHQRPWLQHPALRQAIAHSVDRQAFIDTVYLGEAVPADSIISPGNRDWHIHAPFPAYDPAAARRALRMAGLSDVNGGGFRDHAGVGARFTLLTQVGNTSLERGAAVIRNSLAAVGVEVDIVALETGALVDRIMGGDYDVAYFGLVTTDSDPALNLDFWLSSGGAHVWNPEQRVPATSWESAVDRLMNRMAAAQDPATRHALFADVQRIIAQQVPVLCFAFPRQQIALATRIAGATPTAFRPPVLWNAASLRLRTPQ